MTQPESRTVEERIAAALSVALSWRGPSRNWTPGGQSSGTNSWPTDTALLEEAQKFLAAAKEHGLVIGEGELDVAWKEAEAALPDGWAIYLRPSVIGAEWHAQGRTRGIWMMANGPLPEENAEGPTPTAALHALAERLRR